MVTNKNSIIRLSRYKNAIQRMKEQGAKKVFSNILGDAIGVKPSQVRKDFSIFGITGNKKAGYNIDELLEKLYAILGKNEVQKIIIVGAGRIGAALKDYQGFIGESIEALASFDVNEEKIDRTAKIPILPIEEIAPFVKEHGVKIAIIAVPDNAAQSALDMLIAAGIRGVLNFAPIRLIGTHGVIIHNINLAVEIENLFYFVKEREPAR